MTALCYLTAAICLVFGCLLGAMTTQTWFLIWGIASFATFAGLANISERINP